MIKEFKQESLLKNLLILVGKDPRPDSDYDANSLAMGVYVELEHTSSPEIAKKIAKDHLSEDKDYYTKLKQLGL